MDGWVKLHRKFLEWEWFSTPNMVHLFIHLLLSANHEDKRWQGVEVKRGQLITGLHSIKAKTGVSVRSIRTCLDRLEQTGEITRKSTNKFSVITICKYSEYQSAEDIQRQASDKQATSKRQANDNKQECKNEKNEKKEDKSIVDKSARPTLEDVISYCRERGGLVDAQRWFDYYSSNGWRVGRNAMKDWKAAVRTWEKNGFSRGVAKETFAEIKDRKLRQAISDFVGES